MNEDGFRNLKMTKKILSGVIFCGETVIDVDVEELIDTCNNKHGNFSNQIIIETNLYKPLNSAVGRCELELTTRANEFHEPCSLPKNTSLQEPSEKIPVPNAKATHKSHSCSHVFPCVRFDGCSVKFPISSIIIEVGGSITASCRYALAIIPC